ncbi:hypothetical protein THAOC_32323 [Thalassiosira oceanica]|uniref:Uncharacterized protein n=1 Tax=Thalassiosira oceanica TaxID=159749 RepID=K0R693_THAOC|nr:hypothetical protein THAOC_32323 [Thalassiosira oceanica]|eukprot:EJK48848.1 hypothetical protein THAOC_32323 [Thalassiosira oceanica]
MNTAEGRANLTPIQKFHDIISYQFEFGYDLAIAPELKCVTEPRVRVSVEHIWWQRAMLFRKTLSFSTSLTSRLVSSQVIHVYRTTRTLRPRVTLSTAMRGTPSASMAAINLYQDQLARSQTGAVISGRMATSQILARKTSWATTPASDTIGLTQMFASAKDQVKHLIINDRHVGAVGFGNTASRLVIASCPTFITRETGNTLAVNYGDRILNVHELGPACCLHNLPYVQGAGTFDAKWPNAKIPTELFTKDTHPNGHPFTGVTSPHFVFYPKLMVVHAGCKPFESTGLDAIDPDNAIDGLAEDARGLLHMWAHWATEEGASALEQSQQAFEFLVDQKKKGKTVNFAFPTDYQPSALRRWDRRGGNMTGPGGTMNVSVAYQKSRAERAEDVEQALGRNAFDGVLGIVGSYSFAAPGTVNKKNFGTPTTGYSAVLRSEGLQAKGTQLSRLLDANMNTQVTSADRLVTERKRKTISPQMTSLLVKGVFHKEHISTSNPVSAKALTFYHWFQHGTDILKGLAEDMSAVARGQPPRARSGVELISTHDQICAAIAHLRSDVHALSVCRPVCQEGGHLSAGWSCTIVQFQLKLPAGGASFY